MLLIIQTTFRTTLSLTFEYILCINTITSQSIDERNFIRHTQVGLCGWQCACEHWFWTDFKLGPTLNITLTTHSRLEQHGVPIDWFPLYHVSIRNTSQCQMLRLCEHLGALARSSCHSWFCTLCCSLIIHVEGSRTNCWTWLHDISRNNDPFS